MQQALPTGHVVRSAQRLAVVHGSLASLCCSSVRHIYMHACLCATLPRLYTHLLLISPLIPIYYRFYHPGDGSVYFDSSSLEYTTAMNVPAPLHSVSMPPIRLTPALVCALSPALLLGGTAVGFGCVQVRVFVHDYIYKRI